MRSGPKGRSLHSVPPRHVSAFLPAHISSSTHCGKQPITHKGAQAVPELRVGGDLKAASCPLLCIEAAPDTHVTSQMAGHPQGLWTAISSNLKLRTEEALKYFGEFTWLWTNPHECHGMEAPGTKGFPDIHSLELARVSLPPKYGLEVLRQASPQEGRGLLLLRSLTSGSTSNTGDGLHAPGVLGSNPAHRPEGGRVGGALPNPSLSSRTDENERQAKQAWDTWGIFRSS